MGLDLVGMIPGIGEIFDLANAGIYLTRGKYLDAAISASSALLVVGGQAIAGARMARKAADIALTYGDEAAEAVHSLSKADDALDLASGACFTGETLIPTKDGHRPIKDIGVGDEVYSANPETGEHGLKKVKNVFVRTTDTLVHVFVGDTEIKTTPEHPFWVVGKGWTEAGRLRVRDKVLVYQGSSLDVTGLVIEKLEKPVEVYNFEVEDWHTYFVAKDDILVHNSCYRRMPDQQSLADLAEDAARRAKNGNPITETEAKILDQWASEYEVPQHHPAYPGSGAHFPGGNYSDHTHIYNIHVPYKHE